MFGWFSNKKRVEELDDKTQRGFSSVRDDMNAIGKWIKHLDKKDKQVFDIVFTLKEELSTLKEEIESLREGVELAVDDAKNKQVFKKLPVLNEQTAVQDVQDAVQTPVQTGNFHGILHGLSGNERLVVMTLMNSDMKLSYEDLALLLGKERSTVRGQVNSIKQKSEGLIQELIEKNGKKRVYVPEEVKEKMQKYAKVRGVEKRRNKR
jgi:predicted transcriptional regulator